MARLGVLVALGVAVGAGEAERIIVFFLLPVRGIC